MISFDLHSLGFDAPDLDTLVQMASDAGAVGVPDVGDFSLLAAYTDPSGARLGLLQSQPDEQGVAQLETMASLVAPTTHPAEVVRFSPTVARVDVLSPQPGSLLTGDSVLSLPGANRQRLARFLAHVDDPVEYPLCPDPGDETPSWVEHLRVGAVAADLPRVHESEEAYGRSEEGALGSDGQVQFAAGSLMSPWLMEVDAGRATRGQASPVAEMTMVCQRVEERTNELTGRPWLRVIGQTSIPITLALPADLPRRPHEGSVVTGRVIPVVSSGTWEQGQFWG